MVSTLFLKWIGWWAGRYLDRPVTRCMLYIIFRAFLAPSRFCLLLFFLFVIYSPPQSPKSRRRVQHFSFLTCFWDVIDIKGLRTTITTTIIIIPQPTVHKKQNRLSQLHSTAIKTMQGSLAFTSISKVQNFCTWARTQSFNTTRNTFYSHFLTFSQNFLSYSGLLYSRSISMNL